MPTTRVIPASPRVGATRRGWEERASQLYRAVLGREPKMAWSGGEGEWGNGESCGGFEVEDYKIVPEDYQVALPGLIPGVRKVRGYAVIGCKQVGGGWYEPPSVEEFLVGNGSTPEEAISIVLRRQVDDVVEGFLTSLAEERVHEATERYYEEMDG